MRHIGKYVVLGTLGTAVLVATGFSCKAGPTGFGSGGSGGAGGPATGTASGPSGPSGTTGSGFGTSSASTGAGSACTTPDCLGNGQQGGCDTGLAIASSNAMDGAKAIGLCKAYTAGAWGVKTAAWVRADGSPLGMGDGGQNGDGDLQLGKGILSNFGSVVKPREGTKLLALSSGSARNPTDPNYHSVSGYWKDNTPHNNPTGGLFPKDSPSCPGVMTAGSSIYDSAGLQLVIHTPTDAKGISFDFDFYTYEFPDFVCSPYNDSFIALLEPKPANLPDPNISFDSMGNNISVNAGFVTVCSPQTAGGKNFPCAKGTAELAGTGFDEQAPNGSAATSWLTTTAPVPAGQDITLTFAIWDTGDGVLDSTVLVDNFKFQLNATVVGTNPIPM
jgi:hypothetical protein